jgi:PPOX class probable F420-dependent enzyme
MTLADDAVHRILTHWPIARLATIGPDGFPHLVPIVFARVGDRLWSAIDGKPKGAGEPARVRNLRARPRASLLLDDYVPEWRALWWVRASVVGHVVDGRRGHADVDAAIAALTAKYPQYARVPVVRDPPILLAFDVQRIRSWCASADAVPSA